MVSRRHEEALRRGRSRFATSRVCCGRCGENRQLCLPGRNREISPSRPLRLLKPPAAASPCAARLALTSENSKCGFPVRVCGTEFSQHLYRGRRRRERRSASAAGGKDAARPGAVFDCPAKTGFCFLCVRNGGPCVQAQPAAQVFLMNSVPQTGQVMAIFPFPFGTRSVLPHLGQR